MKLKAIFDITKKEGPKVCHEDKELHKVQVESHVKIGYGTNKASSKSSNDSPYEVIPNVSYEKSSFDEENDAKVTYKQSLTKKSQTTEQRKIKRPIFL